MTRTKEQILADCLDRHGINTAMTFTKEAVLEAMEEYANEKRMNIFRCHSCDYHGVAPENIANCPKCGASAF